MALKMCCCFSLRTGAIIIGIIGLIGAIVGIVYLVVVRYFISDIATYFAASVKRPVYYTDWASNRTGTDADQLTNDVELQQFLVKIYSTYLFVFALLREILGGILSTLLLRGSVKRQRTCFLPWLIYTAIVMIGTIIWIIICVVLMPFLYGIAFCAVGIWELLLMIYFWAVIYSYYQHLKERNRIKSISTEEKINSYPLMDV